MNWILKEYLNATPFYVVGAALYVWAFSVWFPAIAPGFWIAWSHVLLGSYLCLTLWIVVRILHATYKKRSAK